MDPTQLLGQYQSASNSVAATGEKLPGMLETFKQNLSQVYNKANPLIQQREGLLSNYLSAGDQARAEYLPQNSGQVYSPTQLQAMTSKRQGAALAPLSSLNNLIMGQYGTLKDFVTLGRDTTGALVEGGKYRADSLYNMFQGAQRMKEFEEQQKLEREKLAASNRYISMGQYGVYDTQKGNYLTGGNAAGNWEIVG